MASEKDGKIFNIGDSVWIASFELQSEKIPCPVCFGTLKVTLVLGNGDQVILPCDYCGKGDEGPKGYIEEYRRGPRSESIIITEREISETSEGRRVRYHSYNSRYYEAKDVFETTGEALAESQKRADSMAEEEKNRAEHLKKSVNKSYSWNVGYHLREVKRLKEQIIYHERNAILCKEKDKKENQGMVTE